MNPKALWNNISLFVIPLFAGSAILLATPGWGSSTTTGGISGTYQVVGRTEAGAQTRVRLKVHLTNHGRTLVHIDRLGLEDVTLSVRTAHKEKAQACSVAIAAGGAADTTQEFTIPRPEFRTWQQGGALRLLLEIEVRGGHKTTEAVRLVQAGENKASGGEVK
jgi:hypothetical protein